MDYSHEQNDVINSINDSQCVFVDSVAGSGKTTTVLGIALKNSTKNILQLTYNASLKIEVRRKCKQYNLKNLTVHTYHSLCVNYYYSKTFTDEILIAILKNFPKPKSLPQIQTLIIDEAQDMTLYYYVLICNFIKDHFDLYQTIPNVLILGDKLQSIYGFKGSDRRFLTLSNEIWSQRVNKKFIDLKLTESFRLTHEICSFINEAVIGEQRLNSTKFGTKVDYIVCNNYKIHYKLADVLTRMINEGLIKCEDIFILAPSIRQKMSPLRKIENELVKRNFPCHFPVSDDEELLDEVISKKIVFTTFHQSKGRERKMVIIFNFDSSYFKYYDKDNHTLNVCPSTLYVALTRSLHYLLLIADHKHPPMPFLKYDIEELKTKSYMQVLEWEQPDLKKQGQTLNTQRVSATQLIRHMKVETINEISDRVKCLFTCINPITTDVKFPKVVKGINDLKEDVVILNALALTTMFEVQNSQNSTLVNRIKTESKKKKNKYYLKHINTIPDKLTEYKHYLFVATLYYSINEGIHSKLAQINNYNWFTDEIVVQCFENIEKHVIKKLDYEVELKDNNSEIDTGNFKLNLFGIIDGIDDETIWEFKCVTEITLDHMLQLMIYSWIWNKSFKRLNGRRKFKLLNIRTSELYELSVKNMKEIEKILCIIIDRKYSAIKSLTDEKFIEDCLNVK
jgi:hypothetical protein